MRELLTLKELCRRTGVHRSSVYRMIRRGEWPMPLKLGASSRWPAEEVDAALQRAADARDNLKEKEKMQ
jgi:excisionase family DNA binding protein